jgi:2-methylcitrate dehydratase PrpD
MKPAEFASCAVPPEEALEAAARAVLDTIGVALAGSVEPAAEIVRRAISAGARGTRGTGDTASGAFRLFGASVASSPEEAALANGTAAHALDFDDMCFVSLAHPSAPLVAAAFAAAELTGASGRALLEGYVVGFEIEGRLGRAMNPRHYQRGWHCTSTLGTIGAAAAASRLLGLDPDRMDHALAIAASEACGLKENFGTMVKPLHAGLAARNGVLAALLARAGMTASRAAIEGPQGFLAAMDSEAPALEPFARDLGARWEIVDTGITVKLYPSCAATHPALDAILDLQHNERFDADAVEAIDVGVDPVTPTVLIHERPSNGLEGKFSMHFCLAAAIVCGRIDVDTFDSGVLRDPRVMALQSRVRMKVDPGLDRSAPSLTEARVTVRLRDGRELTAWAHGARGYPARPATDAQLADKFLGCASRVMSDAAARRALAAVCNIGRAEDIRNVTALLGRDRASTP